MTDQPTRRQFLVRSVYGLGGLLLVQCTELVAPGPCDLTQFKEVPCPRLPVASLSELRPNQPVDFDYPIEGLPCFLVKLGSEAAMGVGPESDIVAFSYLCTHMGCSLAGKFNGDHNVLGPCQCHFTTFSLLHRGAVVLGQATEDLIQLRVEIEGDEVWITGVDGILYGELEPRCCDDASGEG